MLVESASSNISLSNSPRGIRHWRVATREKKAYDEGLLTRTASSGIERSSFAIASNIDHCFPEARRVLDISVAVKINLMCNSSCNAPVKA